VGSDAARTEWVRLAQTKLKSSREDYVQALQQPTEPRGASVRVELVGRVPNLVENGQAPHDLRDTVIPTARTKRTSRDGHEYVYVPFRHQAPGGRGKGLHGRRMPTPIHNVAKALAATRSRAAGRVGGGPGRATVWGERLHMGLSMSEQARKILGRLEKPWHKSSIYEGMVRQEKVYERARQNQYKTWRTISTRPGADPRSWKHPGIKARHFARKVADHIGKIQGALFRTTVQ